MSTILIRTVILYVIVVTAIKIMGKRQIGEVQVSEFVITLLISDLVANSVMDGDIPLVYMAIPMVTLLAAEVITSYIGTKNKTMKSILDPLPCILIEKGEIKQDNLKNVRFTVNELISEVRLKGCADITEIDYAILESNGKLSVIPKPEYKNPTAGQLNLPRINNGIAHPVVINGELNIRSVAEAGKTSEWVIKTLSSQGFDSLGDIFLMLVDNTDKIFIQPVINKNSKNKR